MRVEDDGRYVICSKTGTDDIRVWTPKGYSARTLVHEYGGGAIHAAGGILYFSNFEDQRLYRQTRPDEKPEAITPEGKGWRYADMHTNPQVSGYTCSMYMYYVYCHVG